MIVECSHREHGPPQNVHHKHIARELALRRLGEQRASVPSPSWQCWQAYLMLTVSKSPESHNKAQSAGSGQAYLPLVGDICCQSIYHCDRGCPKIQKEESYTMAEARVTWVPMS